MGQDRAYDHSLMTAGVVDVYVKVKAARKCGPVYVHVCACARACSGARIYTCVRY